MSGQKQLFDVQLPPPKTNSHESKYQKFKRITNYKKSNDKIKKCANCEHLCVNPHSTGKYWYKCDLMGVSNGLATDIRLSYICDKFLLRTNGDIIPIFTDLGFWDKDGNYIEDIQPITDKDLI